MSQAKTPPVRGILRTSDAKDRRAIASPSKDASNDAHLKSPTINRTGGFASAAMVVSPLVDLNSPRRVRFSPYEPTRQKKTGRSPRKSSVEMLKGRGVAPGPIVDKDALWKVRRMRMRYALARRESFGTRLRKNIVGLWKSLWSSTPQKAPLPPILPDLCAIDQDYVDKQNRLMTERLRQGNAIGGPRELQYDEVRPARIIMQFKGAFDALMHSTHEDATAEDAADPDEILLANELPGIRRHRRRPR
ncbi:unnamed protein product [Aphanomyces euteiches]|uniref:Uncharacterized protein n=1 Tax=Aphanomyces euteiches TaxID=100861 RepID=A0A6G0XBD6_9STRA|nr:hypothetical protein Ae201684_006594 [Aphanomyces euteiches]KAH9090991.1 hypothetical protein Ae201684P_006393 [Aphanomyces euteiches]KAH9142791.1 hypothetical protein AeRB84_013158 [Aphanomyces euteiches]